MIGMIIEPVIYLVVWSSIARQQGGEVGGYTPETFAAYYIVWTLVRNMNIVFTPFGWEERIREGQMSGHLVRPVHPIHYDLGIVRRLEGGRDRAVAADRRRAHARVQARAAIRARPRSPRSRSRSGAPT